MKTPDPLGQAMLDYWRGEYEPGACVYVDGDETEPGHVEGHYFGDPFRTRDRDEFVTPPVLDVGCGAGREALRYQNEGDVIAMDVSPSATRVAVERGVEHVFVGDMFDLPLPDGAVRTVHCFGTQAGLAGSHTGLSTLLSEFARVTGPAGRAIVDAHDPTAPDADELFGFRPDPRFGVARRAFHFEYDDIVGRSLVFLLLSPDRFRDAVAATEWQVDEIRRGDGPHYLTVLRK